MKRPALEEIHYKAKKHLALYCIELYRLVKT